MYSLFILKDQRSEGKNDEATATGIPQRICVTETEMQKKKKKMHTPLGLESFVSSTITMKIKEYFIYLNTTDHGTWEEKTSSV